MKRAQRLKPGTICITVNSDYPVLNNGALVVVLRTDFAGFPTRPYRVARVDGQPLACVTRENGGLTFFKTTEAWCCRRKLKPVDDGADPHDITVETVQPAPVSLIEKAVA